MNNQYLIMLTKTVAQYLTNLDRTMEEKSTEERGRKIAKLSNFLEMKNDEVMYFGLDYSWKKINKIKKGEYETNLRTNRQAG